MQLQKKTRIKGKGDHHNICRKDGRDAEPQKQRTGIAPCRIIAVALRQVIA